MVWVVALLALGFPAVFFMIETNSARKARERRLEAIKQRLSEKDRADQDQ